MNKYRPPKSSVFFLEIMLNILFFAVLATICIQLLLKAHILSKNALILNHAVSCCTSIAEVYQSKEDGKEMIMVLYPNAIALNKTILFYFDENYLPCTESDSIYRAVLEYDEIQHTAQVSFYPKNSHVPIYILTFSSYMPETLSKQKGAFLP